MQKVDFFLGANAPDGFVSFFDQLTATDLSSFLLKGAPGTGKSTMIKSAIDSVMCDGIVECIHCASDPNSLDGALFHELGSSIVDATSPHNMTPSYPGAVETEVNLFDCMDIKKLHKQKDRIIPLFAQKKQLSLRCQNFLNAANSLLNDSFYMALEHTDTDKLHRATCRICSKEFQKLHTKGKEHRRMLSAITPDGVITYTNTAKKLCDRLYVINDNYGCSSKLLLNIIRSYALEYGYEIFTCYCPLNPLDKIDHLLIPQLGLGFMTAHRYNEFDFEPYRVINFTRFTNMSGFKQRKQRLSFNRKASSELITETVSTMQLARDAHMVLEKIYTSAIDFDKVSAISKQLNQKIQL